jgi:iron(III) transport system substrate-binding protein
MKKQIFAGVLLGVLSIQTMAIRQVTIYGYSKAKNETGKESIYDRLVQRFNETLGREKGIELSYLTKRKELNWAYDYGKALPAKADMIQISDSLQLGKIARWQILSEINSPVLESNIPSHLRDDENKWFGITKRYRILYANVDLVKKEEVSGLPDLSLPQFKNKLCLRNASKSYSLSFMSFLFDQLGKEKTKGLVGSWLDNNPKIKAKDMVNSNGKTGVLQAVQSGECSVGLANTYYLGHYLEDLDGTIDNQGGAGRIRPIFPDKSTDGVHVNLKSFAILESSPNQEAAQIVLEWLSGVEAQKMLTWSTHEHPVNNETELSPFHKYLESFQGPINENKNYDLEKTFSLSSHSLYLMRTLGWQ